MIAPKIEPLRRIHLDEAGTVLGRAFVNNPAYLAFFPQLDAEARMAAVRRVNRSFASATIASGQPRGAWIDGRLVGAALALGPGQYPWPASAFLTLALGVVQPAALRSVRHFLRFDLWSRRTHVMEPHYYLFVIGVEPAMQGRGIGNALLAELDARADADRMPSWLETDKEENLRIYRRHGYDVVHDDVLALGTRLRMWTMRREPRV